MSGVWRNERGSALLLVMMGVMIAGIVFGGLYLVAGSTNRQAETHREQVAAEYDAQGMMNIALAYYYNNRSAFDQMFPNNNSCIDAQGNPVTSGSTPNVCLHVEGDKQTLVATGIDVDPAHPSPFSSKVIGTQSNTISYTLASGGAQQPPTPQAPSDANPNPGQTCPSVKQDYILRAWVAGSDFDTSRSETGLHAPAEGVHIDGGLYLGNEAALIVPKDADSYTITINGNVTAEGGYHLDHGDGNGDAEHHPLSGFGKNNSDMSCTIGASSWNDFMTDLATQIGQTAQKVPVYLFTGNVDVNTRTGKKKAVGETYFSNTTETLGSILSDNTDKIVLVQGNLTLPSAFHSTGYLVVYNTATMPGTILLPDGVKWTHDGAVATERVGPLAALQNGSTWPAKYQVSVVLTNDQFNHYKQTK